MSFLISLVLLAVIFAAAAYLFFKAGSGVLRSVAGLAAFCVAVAFLVPVRRQYQIVFPSPFEEVVALVEGIALYGVNLLAGVLRIFAGILGLS